MKKTLLILVAFLLLNSCDIDMYGVDERIPQVGTLKTNEKKNFLVSVEFMYSYTESCRAINNFYNVPYEFEDKLARAKNPGMCSYSDDLFYYVPGSNEMILHMDFEINHNLINIYWPKKSSYRWLHGNDDFTDIEYEVINYQYNLIVDSLVNIAKQNEILNKEIYYDWVDN